MMSEVFAKYIVCIMSSALLCGCNKSESEYTRNPPPINAIAGGYAMTVDNSGSKLPLTGEVVLRLDANGTFTMSSMPGWLESGDSLAEGRTWNGRGKWKIGEEHSYVKYYGITLDFDEVNSQKFGDLSFLSVSTIALLGEKSPYRLKVIIGDPDSDRNFILGKTED